MIFEGLPNAPSTAHGTRSAAATELRRIRCCDGFASATELRSVALILRVASATELMLLRRSCADQLRRAHSARRVSTRRAE